MARTLFERRYGSSNTRRIMLARAQNIIVNFNGRHIQGSIFGTEKMAAATQEG